MNSIIGVIAIIAVTILLNIILDYFILDRDNDKDNSDLISIIKNKKKIIIYLVIDNIINYYGCRTYILSVLFCSINSL